jgi:hypothetical protein
MTERTMTERTIKVTKVAGIPVVDPSHGPLQAFLVCRDPLTVQGTVFNAGNPVMCTLTGSGMNVPRQATPTSPNAWTVDFGILPPGDYFVNCAATGEGTVQVHAVVQQVGC